MVYGHQKGELMNSEKLAFDCAKLLVEKHAEDVKVFDIKELTDIADYFVIASANSQIHLKALVDELEDFLEKNSIRTYHVEGLRALKWVLVDTYTVIIHLFLPEVREYYDLESYWGDAEIYVMEG